MRPETSFAITFGFASAAGIWAWWRHGRETALGTAMAVSLLAGSWFEITPYGIPINACTAVAIVFLIALCFHSPREILKSLQWLDLSIGFLLVWHWIVDVYHGGSPWTTAAMAYGEWVLPYAAGRYAFIHKNAIKKLPRVFTWVGLVICSAIIFEALTNVNLWEYLFTPIDDRVARSYWMRYGLLYRAVGPFRHPIFTGIVIVLLLPFALDFVCRQRFPGFRWQLGLGSIVAHVAGVLATVSRGPVLCIPIALLFAAGIVNRWARTILLTVILVAVVALTFYGDQVLDALDYQFDSGRTVKSVVTLDERSDPEVYTHTRQRVFVLKIYGPLVIKGGIIGYGTEASSGFPPRNIPGLPTDPQIRSHLGIVDNSYINFGLRFGLVGLGAFAALMLTAIVSSLRLALISSVFYSPGYRRLFVAYAGILASMLLETATVFWSRDYSFWLLFHFGVIAGLSTQKQDLVDHDF